MARTALTVQALSGPFPDPANMDNLVFTAADVANMNEFVFTGREIIIARNTDASPRNITLTSSKDPQRRLGNVTKAIAASAFAVFQASDLTGWLQTGGRFWLEADNANVQFAIIRLK